MTHAWAILWHFAVVHLISRCYDYVEVVFDNISSSIRKDHSNVVCRGKRIEAAVEAG